MATGAQAQETPDWTRDVVAIQTEVSGCPWWVLPEQPEYDPDGDNLFVCPVRLREPHRCTLRRPAIEDALKALGEARNVPVAYMGSTDALSLVMSDGRTVLIVLSIIPTSDDTVYIRRDGIQQVITRNAWLRVRATLRAC